MELELHEKEPAVGSRKDRVQRLLCSGRWLEKREPSQLGDVANQSVERYCLGETCLIGLTFMARHRHTFHPNFNEER